VQARTDRHSTKSREKLLKSELKKRVSTGSTEPLGDVIECSASSPYYSGNIVGSMPVGDVTSQSAHHFQMMNASNRMMLDGNDDQGAPASNSRPSIITGFGVHAMHVRTRLLLLLFIFTARDALCVACVWF
jgi:hypothetical protein